MPLSENSETGQKERALTLLDVQYLNRLSKGRVIAAVPEEVIRIIEQFAVNQQISDTLFRSEKNSVYLTEAGKEVAKQILDTNEGRRFQYPEGSEKVRDWINLYMPA